MRIALIGKSGVGKDYLSNHLCDKYKFNRLSFSDELKKISSSILPWMDFYYPPEEKEKPLEKTTENGNVIKLSPREIWMKFDFLREIDSYVFIRGVESELSTIPLNRDENIVISDIRHHEELIFCLREGFKIIYISNPEKIHPDNDGDKYIDQMRESAHYTFKNNMNGIEEFDIFLKDPIFKENYEN